MYGYNNYRNNQAITNELISDLWIQQNVPGGLNSPLGATLDNMMGGNPNPTFGQAYGAGNGFGGYGTGYGYRYGGW